MTEAKAASVAASDYDVVIVGGGAAGLAAAFVLSQAGVRAVVLEAEDHLGGRIKTDGNPELVGLDYGAAYLGPLQNYTMRFCDLLDIPKIPNELDHNFYHRVQWAKPRDAVFKYCKESYAVPDDANALPRGSTVAASLGLLGGFVRGMAPGAASGSPGENQIALMASMAAIEKLVLACRCRLDAPWADPLLAPLDAFSVEDYLQANIQNPYVGDLLRVGVRAALSAEPSEVSMLYLVYYCATGGSFVSVMAVGGGADTYRFQRGATDFVLSLSQAADGTNPAFKGPNVKSAEVRLNARVSAISQSESGVSVTVAGSANPLTARRCIVAMSPKMRVHLGIADLPACQKELAATLGMGRTIKAFGLFKRPWWSAERGASGYTLSAKNTSDAPVVWTMNNTFDYGGNSVPCLMAFIVGERADELAAKSDRERRDAVLGHWGEVFEIDPKVIAREFIAEARELNGYREMVWVGRGPAKDIGCPAGFFSKGMFTKHGAALRAPHGRVHWAGSETATDWVGGYINGALQSGIRAATEIAEVEQWLGLGGP